MIAVLMSIMIGFPKDILQQLFDDSGDFSFSVFGLEVSTYGLLVDGIFNVNGQIFINSLKM